MFNYFIFKEIMRFLRKNFKFIFISIFIAIIILSFNKNIFASDVAVLDDLDAYLIQREDNYMNIFIIHCLKPYINNTDYWVEELKPIFDNMTLYGSTLYCTAPVYSGGTVRFNLISYTNASGTSVTTNVALPSTNQVVPTHYTQINASVNTPIYRVVFYPSTNEGSVTVVTSGASIGIPNACLLYTSPVLTDFIGLIYGASDVPNYTSILNSINNYISSIDYVDGEILSLLEDLSDSLATISSNTNVNYSQQLSDISSNINNLLIDNDTIISQNEDMIEQQEAINDNLENVNNNLENLEDTITDTTVDNDSIFLPSDNSTDITSDGLNGIFTSMYNAFCTGSAQDVVFPIPFTNKNITLQANYVRNMLSNNNASWVITIIEAFWWYLISRFIIKDIANKITKIKSGNIESIENSNIKGDML